MKVYGFLYNGMTEESGYSTISLHKTKEGAEKAMNEHRDNEINEFEIWKSSVIKSWEEEEPEDTVKIMKESIGTYDRFKDWCIEEVEILD